jgi:hypothetical protein
LYIKKYNNQKKNKERVINYTEVISEFFGEGINSLILKLSDSVINVLIFNLLIDWLFRLALVLYCMDCYFKVSPHEKRYIFIIPIAA